jgi:hypothetical protein
LGYKGIYYTDKDSLVEKLLYADIRRVIGTGYDKCTPELVMAKFKDVFLD